MTTALITGASSGIGKAFAEVFAKNKYDLILVARREDKIIEIKKDLETKYKISVKIVKKDLSEENSAKDLFNSVKEIADIDVLVNNAGFGDMGFLVEQDYNKITKMIDLNIRTLTQLSKLFAEDMTNRKNKSGKESIINIASIAGFVSGPLNAVYCATKSYVVSFSCALSNELKDKGVTVICLCPGATESEFFRVARVNNAPTKSMSAISVAEIGFRAMQKKKMLEIAGSKNKLMVFVIRHLPIGLSTRLMRRRMGK